MKPYTKPRLTKHGRLGQLTFSGKKVVSSRTQDDIHKLTEYYEHRENK